MDMSITQLNPPIPLYTPKGEGLALLVIDYGVDYDLMWVVGLKENNQLWTYSNKDVRLIENETLGRSKTQFGMKIPSCT